MKARALLAAHALAAHALAAITLAASPHALAGPALPLAGAPLYALPPEASVRRALEALPTLRQHGLQRELAGAEHARLDAGPHEWVARAGVLRREVRAAEPGRDRYREQEASLERGLRWFGKADQDRAIGRQGIAVAEARRADAWHEAGRALMQDWYAALRTEAGVRTLERQHALVGQLAAAAARRVQAGEAPALERMQADTELLRAATRLAEARREAEQALALLAATYRDLPAPQGAALPDPQPNLPPAGADPGARAALEAGLETDNHELALARSEAEWEGLRARRAASERMPDPTVGLHLVRERDGEERTVGLSLAIPLPGAARSAERDAAVLRARIADEQVALVAQRVRLASRRSLAEREHSYRIWTGLREVEAQSTRQADLMARAWEAGECTLAEALLGRRQALEASLAAQAAHIDALAAAARVALDAHALWARD
ncbi:cobalt-zinc-cadmium efflux system outer membrane protein [Massilia sp. UYP11]|uniref:TolC family protein n=1 Tax=Massilia sp. UYP11 TaxID=1756385 RepID=UPI003D22278A